jgi:hypothetical protein
MKKVLILLCILLLAGLTIILAMTLLGFINRAKNGFEHKREVGVCAEQWEALFAASLDTKKGDREEWSLLLVETGTNLEVISPAVELNGVVFHGFTRDGRQYLVAITPNRVQIQGEFIVDKIGSATSYTVDNDTGAITVFKVSYDLTAGRVIVLPKDNKIVQLSDKKCPVDKYDDLHAQKTCLKNVISNWLYNNKGLGSSQSRSQ